MHPTAGYAWRLTDLMTVRGIDVDGLAAMLRDRGICYSDTQVHRLVTQTPERVSLLVIAALCDLLECSPSDLIDTSVSIEDTNRALGIHRGHPPSRRLRLLPDPPTIA